MLTKWDARQRDYLQAFTNAYNQKTAQSKLKASACRHLVSDARASAGFKLNIKELLYPIVGCTGMGSHFIDIDGNDYVDISMGFGALLFGHMPVFLQSALQSQITSNIQLGPQALLIEEVATLIQELTGIERITFCNTGTEAIMTALRLARLKTNRQKIALFNGSYHGFYDGTLGLPTLPTLSIAQPMAEGLPQEIFKDIFVLDYLSLEALEKLTVYADELAAIIIEPVRGRFPDIYSKDYLTALRNFADLHGIVLIFDEVVTGFRCHPGGAQALFDVRADIVVYGKAVAGGLPVGIVGGKTEFMAGIDGGHWEYGDQSYPKIPTTFFAGTFNKNPLTVCAMYAVLQEMKRLGSGLQNTLTEKTRYLTTELNRFFTNENIAISIASFSSLFRINIKQNADIFFYHLLFSDLYVWEGKSFYLSSAHTNEDIDKIIDKIKNTALKMREYNFL